MRKIKKLKRGNNKLHRKNISYIENYLSVDLANNLINKRIDIIDKNFLIRFRIFCMIVWYKIKFEKSITDPQTSLENILKIN